MSPRGLTSHDVFGFLRPEQVRTLSDHAETVELAAGASVYRRGEPARSVYAVLEGQVSLLLTRDDGTALRIEELPPGALFGSCVCFERDTYALTAMCPVDSKLLCFSAESLKRLMEEDPTVGYPLQRKISQTYFERYLDTMQKLQAIVQALPIQVGA